MDLLDTSGLVFFFSFLCVFWWKEGKRERRVAFSICQGHGPYHGQIKTSARPRLKWIPRCLGHPTCSDLQWHTDVTPSDALRMPPFRTRMIR